MEQFTATYVNLWNKITKLLGFFQIQVLILIFLVMTCIVELSMTKIVSCNLKLDERHF